MKPAATLISLPFRPPRTPLSSPRKRLRASAPASPKPTAMREQILVMATSRMRVSISRSFSGTPLSSLAFLVASGFSETARTRRSMRSTGRSTRRDASRCMSTMPAPRAAMMKADRPRFRMADTWRVGEGWREGRGGGWGWGLGVMEFRGGRARAHLGRRRAARPAPFPLLPTPSQHLIHPPGSSTWHPPRRWTPSRGRGRRARSRSWW